MPIAPAHPPRHPGPAPGGHPPASRGFTLIELAVVLFLVALLMGALLGPVTLRLEAEERARAEAYLAEVKQALIGFAVRRGRLPCPDSSGGDGVENRTLPNCSAGAPAQCDTGASYLPHADLGVAVVDPWGSRPRYFVSRVLVSSVEDCPIGSLTRAQLSRFASLEAGELVEDFVDIETRAPNRSVQKVAIRVAAAVLSHGPSHRPLNPAPPPGSDEATNLLGGTRFVRIRAPNREEQSPCDDNFPAAPACRFDDIVDWLPLTVLQYHLVTAGRLP